MTVREEVASHKLVCAGATVTTTVVDSNRQVFHGEYCLKCRKTMTGGMSSVLKTSEEGFADTPPDKKPRHLYQRKR